MRRLVNLITHGGGGGPTTLAGDVTGPSGSNTVEFIQTVPVDLSFNKVDDFVITYLGGVLTLQPQSGTPSTAKSEIFALNGDVSSFALSQPLDGCRFAVGISSSVNGGFVIHRVDSAGAGAGGQTTGSVYLCTDPFTRQHIAAFVLNQGSGDYGVGPLSMDAGAVQIDPNQWLEFELDSVMTDGADAQEQDLTVNVYIFPL